jgi:excisionase family DNA binding protein
MRFRTVTQAADEIKERTKPGAELEGVPDDPPKAGKVNVATLLKSIESGKTPVRGIPPILTTGEVAKLVRVSPRTVSKWCDGGLLGHYRIPGGLDRRIPRESLLDFLHKNGMPSGGPEGSSNPTNRPRVALADYLDALDEQRRRLVEDDACELLGITREDIGAKPRSELPLEREIATYRQLRPTLIKVVHGKYVLIKDDRIAGAFETPEEAVYQGQEQFGMVDFLVHQVLDPDPVLRF